MNKMSIDIINGIGEKTKKLFGNLNIYTINDLVNYYPRGYEKNNEIVDVKDVVINDVNTIKVRIISEIKAFRKGRLVIISTVVEDDTGRINVLFYNQPYLKKSLSMGDELYLKGKVTEKYNKLTITSPKIIKEEVIKAVAENGYLPVYGLTKGLSNRSIINAVNAAISMTNNQLHDCLPKDLKSKYSLCDINYAIKNIHNPIDDESLEKSRNRLVFEEFFIFQLALIRMKSEHHMSQNTYNFKETEGVYHLIDQLPYELTKAQNNVFNEILNDMRSDYVMNRLVQGDVGSGKTIIAALSLKLVVDNGYQGAMMAPTEVLAKQHFNELEHLFEPYAIGVELLVGSMTKKQKELCYGRIKEGVSKLVIGTHALIQDKVEFANLALVITDEQHRFGVNQREKLIKKGHEPHVLVMSATPIPRTLALIIYGDMDISVIDELPPGRTPIKTYTVNTNYRERIYKFIIEEIRKGRQIYIICPMVEENEEMEIESVLEYTEQLIGKVPQDVSVTYLHGKMKSKEKNEIMERYTRGEINILVSTTVIEVGVNVPNATIMIIENAERFGLAQLHQLRGRVGRGKYESHCILITDSKTKITKQRMKVMCESTDGFIISEYDLKLRGPGDLLGLKQHGLPEFKVANIFENMDILKVVNQEVKQIIEKDPLLKDKGYKELKKRINDYFVEKVSVL